MKRSVFFGLIALCVSLGAMEKRIVNEDVAAALATGDRVKANSLLLNENNIVDPNYKNQNVNWTLFEKALSEKYYDTVYYFVDRYGDALTGGDIEDVKKLPNFAQDRQLKKAVDKWERRQSEKESVSGDQTDELLRLVQLSKDDEAKAILQDLKTKINFGDRDLLPLIASTGDLDMVKLFLQKGKGQIPVEVMERALSYSKNNKPIVDALNVALGKPSKEPGELTLQEVKDKMSELLDKKNIIGALNLFKKFNADIAKRPEYAPVWSGAAFAAAQLSVDQILGTKAEQEELIGKLIDAAGKNFEYGLTDQINGGNILHWIVSTGNFDLLKLVIQKLTNLLSQSTIKTIVNLKAKAGDTPLFLAALSYMRTGIPVYKEIYELLIRNGADDQIAALDPDTNAVRKPSELMQEKDQGKGQQGDITDQLVAAIDRNEVAAVSDVLTLKSKGINFNRLVNGNRNILQYAIAKGNLLIVKLLVRAGAPVDDAAFAAALEVELNHPTVYQYIKEEIEKKNTPIVIIPPVGKGLDGALNALSRSLRALARAL
ncbi:MAG TPA: hypothetical protein VHO47_05230 [Candidatus Babeliales bacterium]|nr:hypothetical protein [Candidatus Babeliales bacterium]